jgi:hypothetical protein
MKSGRPRGSFKGSYPTKINGKLTRAYTKWVSMKSRCYNPNHPAYRYYGGKGITVCDRWLVRRHGFSNFFDDLGAPPDGLTLDRWPDRCGNYEPGNVRWATWKEQANNRSKTGKITPDSLRQQAIAAGLPYYCVYQRVKLLGWSVKKALATPVYPQGLWPRKARRHRQSS